MDYFDGLIGQSALKRKLGFYLDAFKKTSKLPFLQFAGPRGTGKSEFARTVAKNADNKDGSKRPLLEINCSVLKNMKTFVESVYIPFLSGGRNINVLWDENQNLPHDISQALLTICNTSTNPVRTLQYGDSLLEFNFGESSWVLATTETDQLFPPLKDRFEIVDFEPYTGDDLKKIVSINAGLTIFEDGILDSIVGSVRGNARSCVKMAENITTYGQKVGRYAFGAKDWKELCFRLNILPHGLTSSEVMILKTLNERGACSLNGLASATGLSRSAIQKDIEQHLLKNAYLIIDGKRHITSEGQKVLKLIAAV